MPSPYEISRTSQIVDVRPWGDRAAEFLSDNASLAFVAFVIIIFTIAIPTLMIVSIPALITVFVAARSGSNTLPLRYPPTAHNPIDGKKGDGILYLGNMDFDKKKEDRLPLESLADKFKECWFADDDMRKHLLVLGSTGSGKSELLKGIFFNALCWGSGFFVADGKADNKLPTDTYNLARFFARDDDLLSLNFLLAGKTPEQVRNSRRRRTNKTNPFSTADADTIVQMGANLLPKVDGDAKNWQEKALNCWRGLVPALCWLRDHEGMEISVRTFVDTLALVELEKLYAKGYTLAARNGGVWPEAFEGLKAYLEVGLPGFKLERALKKHGAMPKAPAAGGKPEPLDQDATTYDQHGYRATQLNPALNLLDKTYGHIFTDKFSEIDMVDVTLNNRILVLLIPSLEKSAQEAESLGKLTVACLRVMMGKNLGAEIEGHRRQILESKATQSNYPYIVALDELGYYFADGIAVMFAQARSLGFSMIAAAQDIEKLTEGSRAAEAGAMLANQVVKIFMRIDDANKTNEMIQKYLGKTNVALRKSYEHKSGFGFKKILEVHVEEIPRATLENLQKLKAGRAVLNAMGDTFKIKSFYVGNFLEKNPTQEFHINRFLQVRAYTPTEIEAMSIPFDLANAPEVKGQRLKDYLTGQSAVPDMLAHAENQPYAQQHEQALAMIEVLALEVEKIGRGKLGADRAIALFKAAQRVVSPSSVAVAAAKGGGSQADRSASHERPAALGDTVGDNLSKRAHQDAMAIASSVGSSKSIGDDAEESADLAALAKGATARMANANDGSKIEDGSGTGESGRDVEIFAEDPLWHLNINPPLGRKPAADVLKGASVVADSASAHALNNVFGEGVLETRDVKESTEGKAEIASNVPRYLLTDLDAVLLRSSDVDVSAFFQPQEESAVAAAHRRDSSTPVHSAAWIGKALSSAVADLGAKGATVVGFTPAAKSSLQKLEGAMGSADPAAATAAVERIVANQTTPPVMSQSPADMEEIDELMRLVEQHEK